MRLHAGNLRKRFGLLVPRIKVVFGADGPKRKIAYPEMLSHCLLPTLPMPEETREEGNKESEKFDQPFYFSFPRRRVTLSQMF